MGKRRNPKDPPAEFRFKPGQSGNPGGVPKGKRISTWMRELGEMDKLPAPEKLTINGRIALARIKQAMKENFGTADANLIIERTEGKMPQRIEVNTPTIPLEEVKKSLANDGAQS